MKSQKPLQIHRYFIPLRLKCWVQQFAIPLYVYAVGIY